MKTKTLFGIGATVVVASLAATLVTAQGSLGAGRRGPDQQIGQQAAQGRGGRAVKPGPQGPGGRFGGAFAGLNLTEEQRTKVTELQRAGREQAAPIEESLREAQTALHRELFADARDAAKIADLTAKVATIQKQLTEIHVKQQASLADLLTAEQRATMREREARGGGPGRGGPGRFRHGSRVR